MKYQYFSEGEFRNATPSCSLEDMDGGFMQLLDRVRELAGIPLVVNSAYRSPEWERKHGRTGTSTHCKGKAVDIRCKTMGNRERIVQAALASGISRIGIAPTYIHLDTDTDKAQNVVWLYDGKGGTL